ncbi:MAG: hypothetical protein RB292_00815 [Patescibacteria group bacterium]|jgi:hypothetical protein|nr:hypothetical protein [Patescibacteria group bacterium]
MEEEKIEQPDQTADLSNQSDYWDDYTRQMRSHNIGVVERDGGFYVDTPEGEAAVRLPVSHEAMLDQAERVGQRESLVKARLTSEQAPLAAWVQEGRKQMEQNQSAFAEAKNAEDIMRELTRQGNLLVAENIVGKLRGFPDQAKRFVIPSNVISEVASAFEKLGYYVKRVSGKGIFVQGDFAAYAFLNADKVEQGNLAEEMIDDDGDDAGDGSSGRDGKKGKPTQAMKGKLGPKSFGQGGKVGGLAKGTGKHANGPVSLRKPGEADVNIGNEPLVITETVVPMTALSSQPNITSHTKTATSPEVAASQPSVSSGTNSAGGGMPTVTPGPGAG